MSYVRFAVQSCTRGSALDHIRYITRHGYHGSRSDLAYTEYGNMPSWAKTPEDFWRASDAYERKNGVSLRQITISLPNAMTHLELVSLARELATDLAAGKPFQMAVHIPTSALGGEPNPHVHIAISDRIPDGIERQPEQMFGRYNATHPEKGGRRKDSGGRRPTELRRRVLGERQAAAERTNAALERGGYDERVDPRSLKEQGIPRPPERHLGQARIRSMTSEEKQAFVADRRKP